MAEATTISTEIRVSPSFFFSHSLLIIGKATILKIARIIKKKMIIGY